MGRNLSKTAVNPATMMIKATKNIAAGDLVMQSGYVAGVMKATTNYLSALTISATTGEINTASGAIPTLRQRQRPVSDGLGNVISAYNNSGANGLVLAKNAIYTGNSPTQTVTITSAATVTGRKIFALSNGNICVVYDDNSTTINFQIINVTDFSVVKSATAIASTTAAATNLNAWDAIPLSGGGFAVIFSSSTANLDKFATYDNTGTVVTAVMTVNTRTGTTGAQKYAMKELSNGNIAIAQMSTNTVSSIGGYYSVITNTGTSVQAFTQVTGATTSGGLIPAIDSVSGYFCVSLHSATAGYLAVYSNAGALQGSVATVSASGASDSYTYVIVNDGTNFYWIGDQATGTLKNVVRITTGGATTTSSMNATNYYQYEVDAFYDADSGLIIAVILVGSSNSGKPGLHTFNVSTMQYRSSILTMGADTPLSNGGQIAIINNNFEYTCSVVWGVVQNSASTPTSYLQAAKYAATIPLGVARAAATAGNQCEVFVGAGTYTINAITSAPVVGSVNNVAYISPIGGVYGNPGTMFNTNVVLRGL